MKGSDTERVCDIMEKIAVKKKPGSIAEAVQEEILSGGLTPGQVMTQNELAESLGVSRMPVREALQVLEYRGLIERLPNSRVRVGCLSDAYLESLFVLCAGLEAEAMRLSGEKARELAGAEKGGAGAVSGSWQEGSEAELHFHRSVYRNHPYLLQQKTLESLVETYVAYAVRRTPEGAEQRYGLLIDAAKAAYDGNSAAENAFHTYYELLWMSWREERRSHAGAETD